MTLIVIDPPTCYPKRGESRCLHDMLVFSGRSTCAFCLGLPDVPNLDNVFVDESPAPTLRWVTCERHSECARCGLPIQLGKPAAFSVADRGLVGECCEDAA